MMIDGKKAALHNLGCKVNAYETEAMQELLEQAGYEIVPFNQPADVYVINTCSVTNIADRKSRQMIHRAKNKNPDAIIVAAGCYVQTEEVVEKISEYADIIIGNNKKADLVGLINQFMETHSTTSSKIDINKGSHSYENMHLTKTAAHTRAFLKVQDGCNQFCSYCIIPYARGRVRSRELEDVCQEVARLAANGTKEIVLTGIHLSSYGTDIGSSLLELIQGVHKIDGIERIRMGSLEPGIITEEFVSAIASMPKVCPHFHLSLQSGCDATLKRMNRKYNSAQYEQGCQILRKYYDHPALTTDVIVGFPGETEEEFQTTCDFVKKIGFYEIHVFPYSKRQGTVAATMENQVADSIKHDRSSALIAIADTMKHEYVSYYHQKEVSVLYEESCMLKIDDGLEVEYFQGYTPEYVKVYKKSESDISNLLISDTCLSGGDYLLVEA